MFISTPKQTLASRRLATVLLTLLLVTIVPTVCAEIFFIHNDHLGTPRAMTNKAGNVVWRATYDPFGKATITKTPFPATPNPPDLNLRFPGQYYDAETGLHYNYYRDYDPSTGRYLQPDPIGLAGGPNPYTYANNNPLRFIDPTGEIPIIIPILICVDLGLTVADFIVDASTSTIDSQMNAERRNQCGKNDPLTPTACDFVQDLQGNPIRGAMDAIRSGSDIRGTTTKGKIVVPVR